MASNQILTEAGTNELEVMELTVANQNFGINVLKIRQILQYDPSQVTPIPGMYHSVLGNFLFHGRSTPLIDLKRHLGMDGELSAETGHPLIVLVCEFNNTIIGFLITGISSIHRMSWEAIQSPSELILSSQPKITGTTIIDNHEIQMLDFEAVLNDILDNPKNPRSQRPRTAREQQKVHSRESIKLLVVDDSRTIRMQIEHLLKQSGYAEIQKFENGLSAYMSIKAMNAKAKRKGHGIDEFLIIVITDIEMPGMDGLTLCKKIKEEVPEVKVLVLSSLITDQIALKCEEVSADGYLSKHDVEQLIDHIDHLCL